MKKLLSLILTATTLSTGAFAQITHSIDVSRADHAPLYDCSIYNFSDDRGDCMDVKRELYTSWDNKGYAVNCYEARLPRREREKCLDLAYRVTSNTHTLDCAPLYGDRQAFRQCEVTKEGYENGRFEQKYRPEREIRRSERVYTPAPAPVVYDDTYRDLCGPEAYQRNYDLWMAEKERLESRGKKRAIGGAVLGGIGIILGGSRDGGTRAAGTLLTIGGGALIALGIVDLADANMTLPSSNPVCRQYYVPEVRMVTYEREVCRTTQWTERGWGYSRSYYEINCSTRTYVSYERDFSPWHSGRRY